MDGIIYSFEKLNVWQEAKALVIDVYRLLEAFPLTEKYALCDQIRRAIISVPSNIAEGSGRTSVKEKIHFVEIAYGSLMEVYNQLLIAVDLQYIHKENLDSIKPNIDNVAKMLNGLRTTFYNQLTN